VRQVLRQLVLPFVATAVMLPGCSPPGGTLYERLQDENPTVRVRAVIQAGQAKDPKAVPYLIDRLSDSERDVQFYAFLALEKITGHTADHRYYDSPQERAAAEQQWRQWSKQQRETSPHTQEAGSNPS